MLKLSAAKKKDFYERSYKSVDGLWFMKTEAVIGFDRTLDIDNEVWKIMPKIQARMLKPLVRTKDKNKALTEAFTAKLDMDGFKLKPVKKISREEIVIETKNCPWFDLLKKSNREHLAEKIGSRICSTEYQVWADEFETGLSLEMKEKICSGGSSCVMRFYKK